MLVWRCSGLIFVCVFLYMQVKSVSELKQLVAAHNDENMPPNMTVEPYLNEFGFLKYAFWELLDIKCEPNTKIDER